MPHLQLHLASLLIHALLLQDLLALLPQQQFLLPYQGQHEHLKEYQGENKFVHSKLFVQRFTA